MFRKLLIANRGEIACRIIKTARRMGIATVAVYSEADVNALHVEMADEAAAIGPAPSAQSYLRIDRIVQACRDTGAEAVHPGYGFLSEREGFAAALAEIGVTFIGPNAKAIAAMGDKIESKKLALAAGVSVVPGYVGEIRDDAHARALAGEIGYPVMVKASAGGGGKGLRIVHAEKDLLQSIRSSQNEARASFGDDRLFIEKYVTEPRHIEIQVLGDKHGNVIHLNERECSIQRRHQKVIEEAPSPFLDATTRRAMGKQAVALARAVDYDSAGTVEFIVDRNRNFYFLEMNTRLQVEHPVTELVTGLDLVELMIRVAAGEKLPLTQKDVKLDGWAIESRIYAEDPYRGFLPSTGRLVRYRPPAEGHTDEITLRNDTGVYEGGEISIYYDPMIAKLCTHAPSRMGAIGAMAGALDEFRIEGISQNIPFLAAIMHSPRFREGRLSTGFIAEEFPDGFHGRPLDGPRTGRFVAAAIAARIMRAERASAISGTLNGPLASNTAFIVTLGEQAFSVADARLRDGRLQLFIDGEPFEAQIAWQIGESAMHIVENGARHTIQFYRDRGGYRLAEGGTALLATVRRPEAAELAALMPKKAAADTSKFLLCPMPGLVVSINVSEGQEVKTGESLAVIEAMKMENVLNAERDGTIKKINARKGDSLAVDDVILEFA
ncbi:MAG TPA: acetyl/propionyl/methylcrotonyl-CoA carboxylase subunit alpha [Rhizomicrobium sp.]|nr:acetyl/propionyl/methylcrotonyl-CoA carboxylase subunit alpha [Rhizomicrobium sp.]